MTNPLISIIVPVYKTEKYLDKCVESIVNQTYKNLEIILVDDGSPDNCPQMCDAWAKNDSRIKVLHKVNGGDVAARNDGIEIAQGEYIAIIDNDDYMELDMIEYLYNLVEDNDADISRCGFWFEYELGGDSKNVTEDYEVKVFDYDEKMIDILMNGHVSGVIWNKLYKSEILKKHRLVKEDGYSDDILFNFRILKDNPKTVYCDKPKHHYLIREKSMTNADFSYGAFDIITAKQLMLNEFKDNEKVYPYAVKSFVMSAYIVLTGCIVSGKCKDRYDELRESIIKLKKEIFSSGNFNTLYKIKTMILGMSPSLYNFIIKLINKIK